MVFVPQNQAETGEGIDLVAQHRTGLDVLVNLVGTGRTDLGNTGNFSDNVGNSLDFGDFGGLEEGITNLDDLAFQEFEKLADRAIRSFNTQEETPSKQDYIDAFIAAYKEAVIFSTSSTLKEFQTLFPDSRINEKAKHLLFEEPWDQENRPGMIPNPLYFVEYYVWLTQTEPANWNTYDIWLRDTKKVPAGAWYIKEDTAATERAALVEQEQEDSATEPEPPADESSSDSVADAAEQAPVATSGQGAEQPATESPAERPEPTTSAAPAPEQPVATPPDAQPIAPAAQETAAEAPSTEQPHYEVAATPVPVANVEALLNKEGYKGVLTLNEGKTTVSYPHRGASRDLNTFSSTQEIETWRKELDSKAMDKAVETGEGFLDEMMHIWGTAGPLAAAWFGLRYLLKNGLTGLFDMFKGKEDDSKKSQSFKNPVELFTNHYKFSSVQSEQLKSVRMYSLARYAAALKNSTPESVKEEIGEDFAVLESLRTTSSDTLNTLIADLSGDDRKTQGAEPLSEYGAADYKDDSDCTLASVLQDDPTVPISWT